MIKLFYSAQALQYLTAITEYCCRSAPIKTAGAFLAELFMDLDESLEETAVREVREETGLDVTVKALIGIYSKYNDEYQMVIKPSLY